MTDNCSRCHASLVGVRPRLRANVAEGGPMLPVCASCAGELLPQYAAQLTYAEKVGRDYDFARAVEDDGTPHDLADV